MSKNVYEPSAKDRRAVELMAGHGIAENDIARMLGISDSAMQKWYRNELDKGRIMANSAVAQSLFEKAIGNAPGSVAACIFWLKVRAKWAEPRFQDVVPGRKEIAQKAADTAGIGSVWADDLESEIRAN